MNDLISRSKLLEVFNHDLECFETNGKSEKEMYISIADMRKMIKEQSVAYDVDKVVEEMNEALIKLGGGNDCSRCVFREICDRGCIETMIEVYKNIVRKGGVNANRKQ